MFNAESYIQVVVVVVIIIEVIIVVVVAVGNSIVVNLTVVR